MATSYLSLSKGYGGQCLKWVRLCFGVGAKYSTALKAWQNAAHKHTDPNPPANVPVFFAPSRNGYGHVAYSLGNRRVRTTNSGTGTIYNTTIDNIVKSWGQAYLGWTEDLNGVRVYTPPNLPVLRRGSRGEAVKAIQRALGIAADGSFGPQTEAAVRAFQASHGLSVDGIVGPQTHQALGA